MQLASLEAADCGNSRLICSGRSPSRVLGYFLYSEVLAGLKIAIVGLGRVGAVGAACLASSGHEVLGIDSDQDRINTLGRGAIDFYEPELEPLIRAGLESDALRVAHSSRVDKLDSDVIMVAVGTPPLPAGGVNLSHVHDALAWIRDRGPGDSLVVMKSTLPPGTGQALRNRYGLRYVANPEFQQEAQAINDWMRPTRIVAGVVGEEDELLVRRLYEHIDAPWVVTDFTTAEMIKYAANAFLATKISFVNEIANLCDLVGADIDGVAGGMELDPRIGPAFLRAGIGYGGSCFPKDVEALRLLSRDNGYRFELLRGGQFEAQGYELITVWQCETVVESTLKKILMERIRDAEV